MHTIGHLELGDIDTATEWMNKSMLMWGPFNVWTESDSEDQHKTLVDMGCYNFLTGAAGFL